MARNEKLMAGEGRALRPSNNFILKKDLVELRETFADENCGAKHLRGNNFFFNIIYFNLLI